VFKNRVKKHNSFGQNKIFEELFFFFKRNYSSRKISEDSLNTLFHELYEQFLQLISDV